MVESYLEHFTRLVALLPDTDVQLCCWLVHGRVNFYPGIIVHLDDALTAPARITRFAVLFEHATAELLAEQSFTEAGEHWLTSEAPKLQEHLRAATA